MLVFDAAGEAGSGDSRERRVELREVRDEGHDVDEQGDNVDGAAEHAGCECAYGMVSRSGVSRGE